MTVTWPLCRCCGDPYPSDEGRRYAVSLGSGADARAGSYADPPYDWRPANGYCLTCWLLGDAGWHPPVQDVN
jgi:hypothetical protein